MVDATFTDEQWWPINHLKQDASQRPYVDHSRVMIGAKD